MEKRFLALATVIVAIGWSPPGAHALDRAMHEAHATCVRDYEVPSDELTECSVCVVQGMKGGCMKWPKKVVVTTPPVPAATKCCASCDDCPPRDTDPYGILARQRDRSNVRVGVTLGVGAVYSPFWQSMGGD